MSGRLRWQRDLRRLPKDSIARDYREMRLERRASRQPDNPEIFNAMYRRRRLAANGAPFPSYNQALAQFSKLAGQAIDPAVFWDAVFAPPR
jgi:hypothetical protein